MHKRVMIGAAVMAALAMGARDGAAQEFPADQAAAARDAVRQCIAAGQAQQETEAKLHAGRAEPVLQRWIQAEPRNPEPRVRLADVKSRCLIPFASMMGAGTLIGQANTLLEEALQIDSTHWEARFSLAMNHFHTPDFLGRGPEALRHLEILLSQQGDAARPHFANTYHYLAEMYRRSNRAADADALRRRAAALFPSDPRFREGGGPGAVSQAAAGGKSLQMEEIVVEGGNRMDDTRSATALKRMDVLVTPGGTADVMQAFQTGPGTTRAAEGSDLYVRGGDPAESPVFVDGARLFYPGRYETLNGAAFGILDAQVLESAYFSSGGFSARYGDALSGVLDLTTVGRPDARVVRLNANTVQLGTTLDAPLGATAGAWGTVRLTDSRLMLGMHGRTEEFVRAPQALEGMIGAAWEPRAGTEVKLIAMADGDGSERQVDAYGYTGGFRAGGANRLAALSGRTTLAGDRIALRGVASASKRTTEYAFGVLDRARTDRGASARFDADVTIAGGRVSAGVEGAWMDGVQTGTVPTTDRMDPDAPSRALDGMAEDATHVGAYVEAERGLGLDLAVIAGARVDRLPGSGAWTADPRLAVAYRAGPWTLRLAGGVFHKGAWRAKYRVPDAGSPSGTPGSARHLVLGAERGGEPSLKVEGFWKAYGDYTATGEGPAIASGRAAGLDAIVRWDEQKRVNGWITYSYLDGSVELEDGGTAPSAVDVTHTLTAVTRIVLRPQWELGGTLRLGTGRPYTAILGADEDGRPVYGAPNGARMPTYARLDGRLTRYIPMKAGVGVVYLEGLNLLDRANVQSYTYGAGYTERRSMPAFFAQRTLVLGMGLTF
ncbi:MAG TPA: TonB-dependent receptor [Longimicrobium sp.]|nr:TonB-dependent receptor [Longimicrobium sp.]